jgi:hypothetical protein
VGVIRGVHAANGSGMGIDLDLHIAGAATRDALTLLIVTVGLPLVSLSATSPLVCADKMPRPTEYSTVLGAPLRSPGVTNVELDAMSPLLILEPFMEVF